MATHTALIWAAGLFEGEGCIYLAKRGRMRSIQLSVGMNDEDVVRRFHEAVGVGAVYVRPHNGRAEFFTWQANSLEAAQHVITLFWPFFSERRRAKAIAVMSEIKASQVYRQRDYMRGRVCSVAECGMRALARKLCSTHYEQWRHGRGVFASRGPKSELVVDA